MKNILYLTLLAAALFSNVFAFGQGKKLDSLHFSKPGLPGGDFRLGQTAPGYIRPPMVFKASPKDLYKVRTQDRGGDSIRIMAPDRMPCLVTDLSRLERMPVKRQRNLEPMPNRSTRQHILRVEVIPIIQENKEPQ